MAEANKEDEVDITAKSINTLYNTAIDFDMVSGARVAEPFVAYKILRRIEDNCPDVRAIMNRIVDDVTGNGFDIIPGVEKPNESQYDELSEWFKYTDGKCPEWLRGIVHDDSMYGMGAWEISSPSDPLRPKKDPALKIPVYELGKQLPPDTLKNVDWSMFKIRISEDGGTIPLPPDAAYIQTAGSNNSIAFTKDKLIILSRGRRGGVYGYAELIPLLGIIAAQINLTGFVGKLFSGQVPKQILTVGKMPSKKAQEILKRIEGKIRDKSKKAPFGIVGLNVDKADLELKKIIETPNEKMLMELLSYYREEICAVFGIPPVKMGWIETGKMAHSEQQMESWYDVVESTHRRLEKIINNQLLPLLKITDYVVKFKTIRPSKEGEKAEVLKTYAVAIGMLRRDGIISVNKARDILGEEPTNNPEDDDPGTLTPALAVQMAKTQNQTGPPEDTSKRKQLEEDAWSFL